MFVNTITIIVTLMTWLGCSQDVIAIVSTAAPRNIIRTNDRIIFHHLQTSSIATDFWHHTTLFVLLYHKNWPKRSANCFRQMPNHNVTDSERLSYLCHRFPQVIEALNAIYGHAGVYLKQMKKENREAIPSSFELSDDYRKRRGHGTWMESGLSSLFGLVNEYKIKQMKDSVQSILEVSRHDTQEMRRSLVMCRHI